MKANVVANQWPWSLRDVFADTAARVQSLVTAHHHHKATRKDSPILAEPQQSINNVKAWAVLQIKASFADDFRTRPIVNEERICCRKSMKIQCASVLLLFLWARNPDHRETTMKLCDFLYEGLISRNSKSTLFLHSCDWGFNPYISSTQISWNKHSSGLIVLRNSE